MKNFTHATFVWRYKDTGVKMYKPRQDLCVLLDSLFCLVLCQYGQGVSCILGSFYTVINFNYLVSMCKSEMVRCKKTRKKFFNEIILKIC